MSVQAMQDGKRRAEERQRQEYAKRQEAFLSWIKREHEAFALRTQCEALFGRDDDEFVAADQQWHELLNTMPQAPPDHAWS